VVTAASGQYSVLTKESGIWRSTLVDFTTTAVQPLLAEKVATTLSDELVRNFTDVSSADHELLTIAYGATPGAVNLGAGIQAQILARQSVSDIPAQPVRERFAGFPFGLFWVGTTSDGQGFRRVVDTATGAIGRDFGPFGLAHSTTTDLPNCRSDRAGFPSLLGIATRRGGVVGWLESNDAGTACNLLVDGWVLNANGTHVGKFALNDYSVVWEQQSGPDRSGPSEVAWSQRAPFSTDWSAPTKLSTRPVSRLLAQASGPGSDAWMAVIWQECASQASDADCQTYFAKSQSGPTYWTKTELNLPPGSGQPVISINYFGAAVVAWVEPRAACTLDATKQCAQLRGRRFD
jgi:hypothetical protein